MQGQKKIKEVKKVKQGEQLGPAMREKENVKRHRE